MPSMPMDGISSRASAEPGSGFAIGAGAAVVLGAGASVVATAEPGTKPVVVGAATVVVVAGAAATICANCLFRSFWYWAALMFVPHSR